MKTLARKIALATGCAAVAATVCLSPLAGARAQESALSDQEQVDSAEQEADRQVAASQEQVRSALQGVKAAEVELSTARASGDQQRMEQAQAAYDKSVADANTAIGRQGVDVGAMRANGMGWGEIAHASGLHPAALAFGRHKKQAPAQPQPAPAEQAKAPAKAKPSKADKAKPTLSADKFAKGKHRSELTGDNGLSSGGSFDRGGKSKDGKTGNHGNKGGHGKSGNGKGGNGGGNGNGNGGGKGNGRG